PAPPPRRRPGRPRRRDRGRHLGGLGPRRPGHDPGPGRDRPPGDPGGPIPPGHPPLRTTGADPSIRPRAGTSSTDPPSVGRVPQWAAAPLLAAAGCAGLAAGAPVWSSIPLTTDRP